MPLYATKIRCFYFGTDFTDFHGFDLLPCLSERAVSSVPEKLSLGGQLLADPVLERSDLLDVLLLNGFHGGPEDAESVDLDGVALK